MKHGTTAGIRCLYTTRAPYSTQRQGCCWTAGPPIGADSADGSSTKRETLNSTYSVNAQPRMDWKFAGVSILLTRSRGGVLAFFAFETEARPAHLRNRPLADRAHCECALSGPTQSGKEKKRICQIDFLPATFPARAYLRGMSPRTLPITPASFEKVFAATATKRTLRRQSRSGQFAKSASSSENAATWSEIAWEALERENLGDTLRCAIQALSVRYRDVLFLQDVKNLSTAETAWVLDISVGAVRSRLLRARTNVRNALASDLPAETQ